MNQGQGRPSLAFFMDRIRRHWRDEAIINRRYPRWLRRHPPPGAAEWGGRLAALKSAPGFSIIMPVCDPQAEWLLTAIGSVQAQYHGDWELLIADDASRDSAVRDILAAASAGDPRVRLTRLAERSGISAASNAALAMATREIVTFLDHDDALAPHALAAMAVVFATHPDTALAFSDEDQLADDVHCAPYRKPGWNQDLLLSQNLVCHLAAYRRDLVLSLGGLRSATDGGQDWDLALRAAQAAGAGLVRHVPDILYHWRQSGASHSRAQAASCAAAGRRALTDALGTAYRVEADPRVPNWPRATAVLPSPPPGVSVLGASIPAGTSYGGRIGAARDLASADGDVLLFLSSALVPAGPDWLTLLAARAMQAGIGAVGARLEGPDGRVLDGGAVLAGDRIVQPVRGRADADDPGYRGCFVLARTVSAVSGDCLAVRRSVFDQAGGWNDAAGDFAAADLCLRLSALGHRTVWEPAARLRYAMRPAAPRAGAAWMRQRWVAALDRDPYWNPQLRLRAGRVSLV